MARTSHWVLGCHITLKPFLRTCLDLASKPTGRKKERKKKGKNEGKETLLSSPLLSFLQCLRLQFISLPVRPSPSTDPSVRPDEEA